MAVSYKKLWKLLIDKDMKKSDLEREAKITHYALSKLSQGKDVSTEVLGNICETLNCTIDDIIEFVPETEKSESLDYVLYVSSIIDVSFNSAGQLTISPPNP